jgi:hypothetical protein
MHNDYLEFAKSRGNETSYGWDVMSAAPEQSVKSAVHNSTFKNLFLTQQNTKRRLKQNLLQATTTPFVFRHRR